ncbi:MAG TPA: glutathione S-transferase family protein [Thiolinea sp.]|nr:glutathione S-transferase family protein [Thiolinea sp.]
MAVKPKLELVSFKICPFVQRAVIALNEKGVDYTLTHLVPGEEPDWFKQISPMGKVPVLLVDGTPVFESAVIMEYVDEVYGPQLHPVNALQKALHRAWVEYCSNLLGAQYRMVTSRDREGFETARIELEQGLQRVSDALPKETPYFSGEHFALVDTAFAPLFMRLAILKRDYALKLKFSDRVQVWSDALLARHSVQTSVVENFGDVFGMFLNKSEGYLVFRV